MQIGRDSFGREKVTAGAEMVVLGPEIEGLRVDVRGEAGELFEQVDIGDAALGQRLAQKRQ
jgi:hypothetical protein